MFERYAFVAITTTDLARARAFWTERLGFRVTEERRGHFFMVDAGGLRLCIDLDRQGGCEPSPPPHRAEPAGAPQGGCEGLVTPPPHRAEPAGAPQGGCEPSPLAHLAEGDVHRAGGTDPVIGLLVASVEEALVELRRRGVTIEKGPVAGERGAYAELRDPDGHTIVVTEAE